MENKVYLHWIRKQPCAICNDDTSVHAHHYIDDGDGGIGLKNWDITAMPLCQSHHSELHQHGPADFELKYGITQAEIIVRMFKRAVYAGVIQVVPEFQRAA